MENYYNLYSSCVHGSRKRPWYVALKRTGRPRRGRHTRKRQKSSHFLAIHFNDKLPSPEILREHAASRIRPEIIGSAADKWKSFYSTIPDKAPSNRTNASNAQPKDPGESKALAVANLARNSTAADNSIRQHKAIGGSTTGSRSAWETFTQWLPIIGKDAEADAKALPTPFTNGILFTSDMRKRRMEREEKQRLIRRLELANLRRTAAMTSKKGQAG